MKKLNTKKLVLATTTIKQLQASQLVHVIGGGGSTYTGRPQDLDGVKC